MVIVVSMISFTMIIQASANRIDLNGYRIYIDAGHGGKDNGAYSGNVVEDSINLSISKFLVSELVEYGAYVYTSRDGDYDLASNYDKNRKAKDLKKRVELINSIRPDLFVSIHLNTFMDSSVKGGQIFYQNNDASMLLANILQDKFNDISKENKKTKYGDYYLLNNTNSVGVIIECGFLTNKEDLLNLINENYQRKISRSISEGIYEYFQKD